MELPDILFGLPEQLAKLALALKNFMFTSINVAGLNISMWQMLGGAGIVAMILIRIIRN